MAIETGGPAFPHPYSFDDQSANKEHAQDGMTLRDYFAAKALQAIIGKLEGLRPQDCISAAEDSYFIADKMLEARK